MNTGGTSTAGSGEGATGGNSTGGSGGTAGTDGGGATSSGGKGHDLYGDVGTPGTATLLCNGTTCAPHQVCCELALGTQAKCVDSYEACAELASPSDTSPPAYGCVSATQCSGGVCCGTPTVGISVNRFIATSCRSACAANEDTTVCGSDSDCTAPDMCVMSSGPGVCF